MKRRQGHTKTLGFLAVLVSAVIFTLLTSCMTRTDYFGLLTTPDIVVKQGSQTIANGTGVCDFESIKTNEDKTLVFSIENRGGNPLSITGISLISGDTANFISDLSTTLSIIEGHASTDFSLTFDPDAIRDFEAVVLIESNDPDLSFYSFTVRGTGESAVPVPDINLMKGSVPLPNGSGSWGFGNVTVGSSSAAQTFTVQNTGNAGLNLYSVSLTAGDVTDFAIDDSSMAGFVSQGSSTTFTITLTPTVLNSRQAMVSVDSDDPDEVPYTFTVTGTGVLPSPDINIRQGITQLPDGSGSFDLGSEIVGSTKAPASFTVENLGDDILNITGISSSNAAEFQVDSGSTNFTLNPSQTTSFTVAFAPSSTGARSATITVISDDTDEGTYTFTVTGTGQPVPAPEIGLEQAGSPVPDGTGSYSFPTILVGSSSGGVTFTVVNSGTADLTVDSVSLISGDVTDFSINTSPLPTTVAAGSSETFTITFTPTASGARSANVEIINDDSDENPYEFTVTGNGLTPYPEINVKQGSTDIPSGSPGYDYGTVLVGESSPAITFTIENQGSATLNINDVYLDYGEFSIDYSSLSMTVPAAGSTSFKVTFSPSSAGAASCTVYILNDDFDESTYTFTLDGTGQAPPNAEIDLQVSSTYYADGATFSYGNVSLGSNQIVTFTIENNGTDPLEIFNIFLTDGDLSDFSRDTSATTLSPSTVPPGGSTTFTATFTPQATGTRYRNLEINSNDADESPYNIRLEGNGV